MALWHHDELLVRVKNSPWRMDRNELMKQKGGCCPFTRRAQDPTAVVRQSFLLDKMTWVILLLSAHDKFADTMRNVVNLKSPWYSYVNWISQKNHVSASCFISLLIWVWNGMNLTMRTNVLVICGGCGDSPADIIITCYRLDPIFFIRPWKSAIYQVEFYCWSDI